MKWKLEIYVENSLRYFRFSLEKDFLNSIFLIRHKESGGKKRKEKFPSMYLEKMDSLSSLKSIRRHYKKDSRYVNDLYTLTYDNHESLDTVELISSVYNRKEALQVSEFFGLISVVGLWIICLKKDLEKLSIVMGWNFEFKVLYISLVIEISKAFWY